MWAGTNRAGTNPGRGCGTQGLAWVGNEPTEAGGGNLKTGSGLKGKTSHQIQGAQETLVVGVEARGLQVKNLGTLGLSLHIGNI